MYGLPQSTEVNKQLPKKAIYAKFDLKPSQREHFDEDVSKLMIVNAISCSTIPALSNNGVINCLYVVDVYLKRKEYDFKNIIQLNKLIQQKIILILRYENLAQEVIFYSKLFCGVWKNVSEVAISLKGITIDSIWTNLITELGKISIEDGNTLDEQIVINKSKEEILTKIRMLEVKARKEKQTRKKLEYFNAIKELKNKIEWEK